MKRRRFLSRLLAGAAGILGLGSAGAIAAAPRPGRLPGLPVEGGFLLPRDVAIEVFEAAYGGARAVRGETQWVEIPIEEDVDVVIMNGTEIWRRQTDERMRP